MAEATLQEVFGANAAQTSTTLTIQKADLAGIGLTASANNTAESLIVAIVLRAAQQLTETSRATDLVNRNVTLLPSEPDLVLQGDLTFFRQVVSILMYKTTTIPAIDPDDY